MSASRTTGLGMPEPIGKRALFQPPAAKSTTSQARSDSSREAGKAKAAQPSNGPQQASRRVRITTDLTNQALMIIQEIQNRHRLETGKALPLWKAVSEAIEYYGAKGGGHER